LKESFNTETACEETFASSEAALLESPAIRGTKAVERLLNQDANTMMEQILLCPSPVHAIDFMETSLEASSSGLSSVFVVPDASERIMEERTQAWVRILLCEELGYDASPTRVN
jgi:hypothetical protein